MRQLLLFSRWVLVGWSLALIENASIQLLSLFFNSPVRRNPKRQFLLLHSFRLTGKPEVDWSQADL